MPIAHGSRSDELLTNPESKVIHFCRRKLALTTVCREKRTMRLRDRRFAQPETRVEKAANFFIFSAVTH
jgi:hypothetical protein